VARSSRDAGGREGGGAVDGRRGRDMADLPILLLAIICTALSVALVLDEAACSLTRRPPSTVSDASSRALLPPPG
ncbi:unnamed protein product, partial [Urochloa humidicola]